MGKQSGDTHADIAYLQISLLYLSGGIAVCLTSDGQCLTGSIDAGTADVCLVDRIISGSGYIHGDVDEVQTCTGSQAAHLSQNAVIAAVVQQSLHVHHGIADGNAVDVSVVLGIQTGKHGIGGNACGTGGDHRGIGEGVGVGSAVCLDIDSIGLQGTAAGNGGFTGGVRIGNRHIDLQAAQTHICTKGAGSQGCFCIGGVYRLHSNIVGPNQAFFRKIQNGLEPALGIGGTHHHTGRDCTDALILGAGIYIGNAAAFHFHIAAAGDGHGGGFCIGNAFAAAIGHGYVGSDGDSTCAAGIHLCPGRSLSGILIQLGNHVQSGGSDVAASNSGFLGAAQQRNCHGSSHSCTAHGNSIHRCHGICRGIGADADGCAGDQTAVTLELCAVEGIVVCNGCVEVGCGTAHTTGHCGGFGVNGIAIIFTACEHIHTAIGFYGYTGGVNEGKVTCVHTNIAGRNTHSSAANGSRAQNGLCICAELGIHVDITGHIYIDLADGRDTVGLVEHQKDIAVHGKATCRDGDNGAVGIGVHIVLDSDAACRDLTGLCRFLSDFD